VIESRPLPFGLRILYKDTLEGRYRDIIEELRDDLGKFIDSYREYTKERPTPAWFVLTDKESRKNDILVALILLSVLLLVLTLVYFVKKRFQKPRRGLSRQT
jgi:type VI protein secretion system component VasF